ncbi:MAG: RNA polymerase sigma factor [Hydrogenophaga sp.]|uniref:RNA polymerase sigma factor n=1 Tax=Hydrogenophaga sp. TaxID=1904254 RepID=UPI0025BD3372|nr:RNA polymerase sigma factor [Hydrogenophaga sp.]MBT9551431.1 RNA polymerase sigma factor [Hydrogenophaga sp.]
MSEPPAAVGLSASLQGLGRWVGRALAPGPASVPRGDGWALWRAACDGHAPSARDLVHQLTPQAMGLAMQMLARREDAEDVVQESFLRLWNSQPSDTHGAALGTFFNTIVINRCKTWLTRRRELSADPEQLAELSDAWQHDQADAPDSLPALSATQLQTAMARLPARQRMALAMWAYADADVADIARSMELDRNAAHQLLHRAKTALRRQLQESTP